jgi:hypothetical protein
LRSILPIVLLVLLPPLIMAGKNVSPNGYFPKNGFVPDERTAIAIAEAVFIPIYGKEQIDSEKPLKGKLKNGIWTVQGSLPKGWDGGNAVVTIARQNGRIVFVTHYL